MRLEVFAMTETIDWKTLAKQLGTLAEGGEKVTAGDARAALEILLGEGALRKAVEYYIAGEPGSELARAVLMLLKPGSAMGHCYAIYLSTPIIEERRLAVELLRVIADHRAADWIYDFLKDEDQEIQMWGAAMLDELARSDALTEGETAKLMEIAGEHANPGVRKIAGSIRERLIRE